MQPVGHLVLQEGFLNSMASELFIKNLPDSMRNYEHFILQWSMLNAVSFPEKTQKEYHL